MRLADAKHIEALMEELNSALLRVANLDLAQQVVLKADPSPSRQALHDLRLSLDVTTTLAFTDLAFALKEHLDIDCEVTGTTPETYAYLREQQVYLTSIVNENKAKALAALDKKEAS